MIGESIIQALSSGSRATGIGRSQLAGSVPIETLQRDEIEVGYVAEVTLREKLETAAPIELPGPDAGDVRLWMKKSDFNPRCLEVFLDDEKYLAVIEWPRDYYDVSEDAVLHATGREDIFEDKGALIRSIVSQKLVSGAPGVHRTFAVQQRGWDEDEFSVYEEFDCPREAIQRFEELKGEPDDNSWVQVAMKDERKALLRVNGIYGLTETYKGHRLLEAIIDAVRLGRFEKPVKYDDYKESVEDPLTQSEAVAMVNLGVLCSRCPGMTWGDIGYEIMRGIRGA